MKNTISVKKILLVLLAALLLWALLYCLGVLYPSGRASKDTALADWMADIDGMKPLSEINIPGTHDSTTQYIFPSYFLQDQCSSAAEQLENGYRYLDVRVALDKSGEKLVMIHNFGKCRTGAAVFAPQMEYAQLVETASSFLEAHPTETVIFCIKPENGSDEAAKVCALIEGMAAAEPELWYTDNAIPTLDEARGRIVLCRRYDGAIGMDFNWDDQGDPTVLADPIGVHAINDDQTVAVQDRYHYAVPDKWEAVRRTLEKCPADKDCFTLNFLSTAQGKLPHPRSFAREMNALFSGFVLEKGGSYGIILFDFADAALARQVIESNG